MRPRYIGMSLRYHRRRKGLTQYELSERSGIGLMSIHRLERNHTMVKMITARQLAKALGIDTLTLLTETVIKDSRLN